MSASAPCPAAPRQAGFSLVEALVVVALAAILVTTALPSLHAFWQRRHLEGQSAQLLADLQLLRTASVGRQLALRLSLVRDDAGGAGWALHSGDAGSCRAEAGQIRCDDGVQLLRSAWLGAAEPVAVQANVTSMRIDPRQGTLSPTGSWELATREGLRLRHVVNLLGRVRVCTPAAGLAGVPAC